MCIIAQSTEFWLYFILVAAGGPRYELFMYHNEYISSDYKDIKNFIQKCYNMRSYHESSEVWKIIESTDWKKMDAETKKQMKCIIQNFDQINGALFWKSLKREFDIPKNE